MPKIVVSDGKGSAWRVGPCESQHHNSWCIAIAVSAWALRRPLSPHDHRPSRSTVRRAAPRLKLSLEPRSS